MADYANSPVLSGCIVGLTSRRYQAEYQCRYINDLRNNRPCSELPASEKVMRRIVISADPVFKRIRDVSRFRSENVLGIFLLGPAWQLHRV